MFLLRFILLVIVFYIVIQILGRVLFGFGRRASRRFYENDSSGRSRNEGDVHVESRNHKKGKIIRKEEGEYIKYEEIKDE